MATTNFVQINPTEANQEDDATYQADSLTTGGIGVDDIMPSAWMNKAWYQSSTFVAAFAGMLLNKGYSTSDANIAVLEAVLANVLTNADVKPPLVTVAYSPTPVFNAALANGFDLTLGGDVTSSTLTNAAIGQTITFVVTQGSAPFTFSPPSNVNGFLPVNSVPGSVTVQQFIVKENGTIWPVSAPPQLTVNVVTGARSLGEIYQNNSGSEMKVVVTTLRTTSGTSTGYVGPASGDLYFFMSGVVTPGDGENAYCPITLFVPAGWYYQVTTDGPTLFAWNECVYQ